MILEEQQSKEEQSMSLIEDSVEDSHNKNINLYFTPIVNKLKPFTNVAESISRAKGQLNFLKTQEAANPLRSHNSYIPNISVKFDQFKGPQATRNPYTGLAKSI